MEPSQQFPAVGTGPEQDTATADSVHDEQDFWPPKGSL